MQVRDAPHKKTPAAINGRSFVIVLQLKPFRILICIRYGTAAPMQPEVVLHDTARLLAVEQQQSEYQCEERYCLYDTDNDEVVSSTFACCAESIGCSSCASALEEC